MLNRPVVTKKLTFKVIHIFKKYRVGLRGRAESFQEETYFGLEARQFN